MLSLPVPLFFVSALPIQAQVLKPEASFQPEPVHV